MLTCLTTFVTAVNVMIIFITSSPLIHVELTVNYTCTGQKSFKLTFNGVLLIFYLIRATSNITIVFV